MSSRDPMWFCHECHAEMRPLMTPHPICASCRGSFVEKLENPADDPREFQNRAANTFDIPQDLPGAFQGFLRGGWRTDQDADEPPSPPSPQSLPRFANRSRTPDNTTAPTTLRFEYHRSGPGGNGTRSFVFGGPNTLGGSPPQGDHPVPTMFEFLRRESENANDPRHNPHADITGPLMAQYLLALFGRDQVGARGDPFAESLGMPPLARWGDYVFNQETLDQILAHLAETSTAGRPVPASEEIVNNLPREVLTEGSPLLEKDCAVCKESFKLNPDDPDDLVVVTLPCKHPFHEGCILPWLKSSGTCPVCRYALITQPQQHPPGGSSGGGSRGNRTSPSSGTRPRSPGGSGSGGPGFFQSFFGGGTGTSSGSSENYSSYNRSSVNRDVNPEVHTYSTPSFPGQWIEEID